MNALVVSGALPSDVTTQITPLRCVGVMCYIERGVEPKKSTEKGPLSKSLHLCSNNRCKKHRFDYGPFKIPLCFMLKMLTVQRQVAKAGTHDSLGLPIVSISHCQHIQLSEFPNVSISNRQHFLLSAFPIISISNCQHFQLLAHWIVSISNCQHFQLPSSYCQHLLDLRCHRTIFSFCQLLSITKRTFSMCRCVPSTDSPPVVVLSTCTVSIEGKHRLDGNAHCSFAAHFDQKVVCVTFQNPSDLNGFWLIRPDGSFAWPYLYLRDKIAQGITASSPWPWIARETRIVDNKGHRNLWVTDFAWGIL